jgi:hypothetical protein
MTVEIRKGLSKRVIVIGTILIAAFTIFGDLTPGAKMGIIPISWSYNWFFAMQTGLASFGAPGGAPIALGFGLLFIVALIVGLLNRSGHVMSQQEFATLCILVIAAPLFQSATGGHSWDSVAAFAPGVFQMGEKYMKWVYPLLPDVWGPKDPKFWEWAFYNSNFAIDRSLPLIIWDYGFFIGGALVFVFIAVLLRRLYIDVESLAFPMMSVINMTEWSIPTFPISTEEGGVKASSSLSTAPQKSRVPLFDLKDVRTKSFWIGFVPIFIYYMVAAALFCIPTFSPFYGVPPSSYWPMWDPTALGLLGLVSLRITVAPWDIGWSYMMPLDVLTGAMLGYAIFTAWSVIGQVGGFTPRTSYPGASHAYCLSVTSWNSEPNWFACGAYFQLGLAIAFVFYPVWRHRKAISKALNPFKEPPKEWDPDRPIPYRLAWGGLIASWIIWTISALAVNVHPIAWVVWSVIAIIGLVSCIRIICATGGAPFAYIFNGGCAYEWIGFWGTFLVYLLGLQIPDPTSPAPSGRTATNLGTILVLWQNLTGKYLTSFLAMFIFAGWFVLHAFSLGTKVKTRARDMFLSALIALVLGEVIGITWFTAQRHLRPIGLGHPKLWGDDSIHSYVWNGMVLGVRFAETKGGWFDMPHSRVPATQLIPTGFAMLAVGFIVGLVIYLLRDRFPRFRVSMAGVMLGFLMGWFAWTAFLIALILKYLTLRVGGPSLYERRGRPVALGTIMGFSTGMLLWVPPLIVLRYINPYAGIGIGPR